MSGKERTHSGLSEAEWKVMKEVWALKKTNVREVYERVRSRERWAYNTVRTLMERLCNKGYLAANKVGNMYFYTPTKSRRSVSTLALWDFVDKVFDGAVGAVVSQLIEEKRLTKDELRQLREILDEGRKPR